MNRFLKLILPVKIIDRFERIKKEFRNFYGLANAYGQWRTIKDWDSVDNQGNPIPWYTYPSIEFLSHLDLRKFNVFEYGSGNSTLWWAGKVNHVAAVEDDESWYNNIKANINSCHSGIDYRLESIPEKYCTSPASCYDIVIVDGKFRGGCLLHLHNIDWNGVMLILDNSDWHPNSIKFIQNKFNWMQIDFHGFGPINEYTWTTSIFINPKRYQEISRVSELKSIFGLVQVDESENKFVENAQYND